jgi:hypothetical protein
MRAVVAFQRARTLDCRGLLLGDHRCHSPPAAISRTIASSSRSRNVLAELLPIPPPPDIQTLTVAKDTGNGAVVLSWSDGTAPFAVARSESPNFATPTNLAYVTRSTLASAAADPVLNDGKSYYYLVSDTNAAPAVYSIAAVAGAGVYDGDTLVIDGVGFDTDCANVTVYFAGGISATPVSCSATQIQVQVQELTASGDIVVASPSGQSKPIKRLKTVGARLNPSRVEQAHLNVDGNHNLFVCDQGTSDRIWKIDFSTKLASTCFTIGNPVGLPFNEQGRFVFSNDTWSHELTHFFLNQYTQPSPATGEDRPPPAPPNPQCGIPDAKFLMYGADCGTNRVLTPPECNDMKTNGDESTLMEPF